MCGYRTLTGARAPPTGPQAEGDVGPPFSGKRERAPALSLSFPWVLVRLSSSLGLLLKGIHPPFRPIACPGKAAGPGSSPQKPIGSHAPNRPTDSPGRASRSGRQPAKNPKALTHLSVQPPSPGRARLAEFRRPQPAEKNPIIFSPGMYRGKYSSHPESAGFAGAVRGASPNFGRSLLPSRTLDTPVRCPPERSATLGCPSQNSHPSRSSIW